MVFHRISTHNNNNNVTIRKPKKNKRHFRMMDQQQSDTEAEVTAASTGSHPSSSSFTSGGGSLWTSSLPHPPTLSRLQQLQSQTEKLKSKMQTQLQKDNVQKRKQQATNAFKNLGSQLQKINLGKLIDQMEADQGLADSLEQLNGRMKEEVERQEIRREAEALGLKVIQDHLVEMLDKSPETTYEEWIQDLHPENANMGRLLNDIQEIDPRFYVFQSDHRRLWNEAMNKLEQEGNESARHRRIEPRTTKWGDDVHTQAGPIDLLSGSSEFQVTASTAGATAATNTSRGGYRDSFSPRTDNNGDDGGGNFFDVDPFEDTTSTDIDPFAPLPTVMSSSSSLGGGKTTSSTPTTRSPSKASPTSGNAFSQDEQGEGMLIKF